jgi:hypothetical protein
VRGGDGDEAVAGVHRRGHAPRLDEPEQERLAEELPGEQAEHEEYSDDLDCLS